MPRLSLVFLCLFLPGLALGSTWIGNGGSILDTELRTTLAHLKQAVRASSQQDDLCRCSLNSDQCAILRDLSEAKVRYCADFIRKEKDHLLDALAAETRFEWSSERLKTGNSRDFDAIAQPKEKRIIIDEARFAKMTAAERLQLIAHEYLHFLGYKDEGAIGPFAEGRQLLDTAGAALTVVANRSGALPFRDSRLSRPYRNVFVWFASGKRSVSDELQKISLYAKDRGRGDSLGLTWYPRVTDHLGWSLMHSSWNNSNKSLVKSMLSQEMLSLGPEYRLLPFSTGNRFLDAFQISGTLSLTYNKLHYTIADAYNSFEDKQATVGAMAAARLQIPFFWDFWILMEQGYAYAGLADDPSFQYTNYGVSYAFQF